MSASIVPEAASPARGRHGVAIAKLREHWLPIVALLLATFGVALRLSHPDRAYPWFDEFRTLLHASGHSYDDLSGLPAERGSITAEELERRYLRPSPGRTVLQDLAVAQRTDVQVSPLYYGLVRLAFSDSTPPLTTARYVAAFFSCAALAASFWLCLELFGSRRAAWAGLALFSVSPGQLYWAFEARPYSLWLALFMAATAALLRATRLHNAKAWLLYAALAAVMLWSHLFSLLILVVHAAYVVWYRRPALGRFGAALGGALLLASPWLLRCAFSWREKVAPQIGWLAGSRHASYFDHVSLAIGHGPWTVVEVLPLGQRFVVGIGVVMAALALLSLKAARPPQRLLILGLFGAVLVPLAIMDAALGGVRLSNVRYLLPASVALLLAAVSAFAVPGRARSAGLQLLLGFCLIGSLSVASSELPEGKWRTEPITLPGIARSVARFRKPVLVSFGQVSLPMSLSLVLPDHVELAFFKSEKDIDTLRELSQTHDVLLMRAASLPWYYEPEREQATRLFEATRKQLQLAPVARGLYLVRPN